MNDYIFCPMCASTDWKIHKLYEIKEGRITRYECNKCHKFNYKNLSRLVAHPLFVGVTEIVRYCDEVTLDKFFIRINYLAPDGPATLIQDSEKYETLLSAQRALKFDWCRHNTVIEKVKMYLVFT